MKLWRYWRLALITTSAIAMSAHSAFAMPAAIGLLGSLATSIAAGASATQIVTGLFVAALSYAAQTILAQMMAPDVKPKGIKQKLESGGDNPLSFILGEYCTAGKLVYVNQHDTAGGETPNNKLVMVISLSELPASSFDTIMMINGERCTIDFDTISHTDPADDGGFFATVAPRPGYHRIVEYDKRDNDKFKNQYCWVRLYDGTQTAADPWLLATFGDDENKPWSSDMVGRGCAYAIVVCMYSDLGIWSGVPEFKFVFRGRKLYDWRYDSTNGGTGPHRWGDYSTYEYSANPVVMKYNIIRGIYYGSDWVWGGQNLDAYRLPVAYWTPAANHCDEDVALSVGPPVKRYAAGCEIHVDQQPIDVLKDLDKSCAGYTSEFGGQWKTWSGPPGSSVLSITDADIIITEEQTDNLFRPSQEIFNGAHGTYTNGRLWVSKDAPVRTFPALVDEDTLEPGAPGLQLIADVQLPYVTEPNQVGRLLRLAVLDSRRQITHVMSLPPEAYMLEPFDVVSWTSDRNGYVNKKFRVEAIDDQPNVNQVTSFREIDPTDYDWDTSMELPETIGTVTQVKPGTLSLDYTITADQVDNDTGGKDKPAINIAWTWGAPDIGIKHVKYEIRRHGTTKVIKDGIFHNTDEGSRTITSAAFRFGKQYDVRLAAVPVQEARDYQWTDWTSVTLFNIDIPTAPTLTRISDLANDGTLNFFLDIDWTAVAGSASYVVRVAITGGSTRTYRVQDNNYRITVTSGKTYTVDVRAVAEGDGGSVGDWSPTAVTTVTKKNTAPTSPTSLTATGDNHRVTLKSNKSPDADFDKLVIYGANSNDFTLAVEVGRSNGTHFIDDHLANNITRYYWATFTDRSANESSKYPASNTAGVPATTVRVQTDDVNDNAVTPAKAKYRDTSNLIRDPDCLDLTLWSLPGGTTTQGVAGSAESQNYFLYATPSSSGIDMESLPEMPVKAGRRYYASAILGAQSSGGTAVYLFRVNWYSMDAAGATTYIGYSEIFNASLANTTQFVEGIVTAPTNAKRATVYARKDTGTANMIFYAPIFHKAVTKEKIGDGEVQEGHTDQTLPSNPTLALTALTADIDGDGTIDTGLSLAITNPNTGVNIKRYIIEIHRSDTSGGTYTLWKRETIEAEDYADNPVTTWTCKANKKKFHKAKVRSVAFGGKKASAFTSFTSAVQPGAYAGYSSLTAQTPTNVILIANGMRVTWDLKDSTGAALDATIYDHTDVYTGSTYLTSVNGRAFNDLTSRTIGSQPGYNVRHFDKHGNVTGTSSNFTTPSPGFRGAVSGEIGDSQVTDAKTDPTVLAAPGSGPTVAQVSKDLNGDGVVDMALKLSVGSLPTGAKSIVFQIDEYQSDGTTLIDTYYEYPKKLVKRYGPVVAGHVYKISYAGVTFNNTEGSFSPVTTFTAAAKTTAHAAPTGVSISTTFLILGFRIDWDPVYEADYARTEFYITLSTSSAPSSGTLATHSTVGGQSFQVFLPNVLASPGWAVYARHVNRSGGASSWVASDTPNIVIPKVDTSWIADEAVDTTQIADGSITYAKLNNAPSLVRTAIAQLSVGDIGTYAMMKNNSGSLINSGTTTSGANLAYSDSTAIGSGSSPGSGTTWQSMGRVGAGNAGLFKRDS